MKQTLILSADQANAVYCAMCALNKIGATLFSMRLPAPEGRYVRAGEDGVGTRVYVCTGRLTYGGSMDIGTETRELHADQDNFAAAYGVAVG